jgi:hypothetical protein
VAATSRWVPDTEGITAFERRDATLYAELTRIAQRGVTFARSIAPVGSATEDDEHPGAYRDSIRTRRADDGLGLLLLSDDEKAHWIEYGARHTRRQQVLGRAAERIAMSLAHPASAEPDPGARE